jgi:hypothetical protein
MAAKKVARVLIQIPFIMKVAMKGTQRLTDLRLDF